MDAYPKRVGAEIVTVAGIVFQYFDGTFDPSRSLSVLAYGERLRRAPSREVKPHQFRRGLP